jgi:hypothetical protein
MVARTWMSSMTAARDAAVEFWSGGAPAGVRLVGLVLVPDRPGRLSGPLASMRRALGGAYPRVWDAPWVEGLRLVDAAPAAEAMEPPAGIVRIVLEIQDLTVPKEECYVY